MWPRRDPPPDRLADHLPWDMLVAPGTVLQKDGSLLAVVGFRPPDLDAAGDEEVLRQANLLAGCLSLFGTGWCLHLETRCDPAPPPDLPAGAAGAALLVAAERRAQLAAPGALVRRSHRLALSWQPPAPAAMRLERLLLHGPPGEARGAAEAVVGPFRRLCAVVEGLLGRLMAGARLLGDAELLTYLHACVSPHAHPVRPPPRHGWPLDELLPDCSLVPGSLPYLEAYPADWHLRTVGVMGYPEATCPGLLDALDELRFPHRYVARFLPLSRDDADRVLLRLWKARRYNAYGLDEVLWKLAFRQHQMEADPVELARALEAEAARTDAGRDGTATGYLTPTLTLWDATRAGADAKALAAVEALRARGLAAKVEGVNAFRAWQGSLPGEARADMRRALLPAVHLADLVPVSAPWPGPDPADGPLLWLHDASGEPFALDLRVGDTGHALVAGPVRTGKSSLLAVLASQFLARPGARVVALDVDGERSALAVAALCHGGSFLRLEEGGLALQPLARADETAEREWAHGFCMALLRAQGALAGGGEAALSARVGEALALVAREPPGRRTLSLLAAAVQDAGAKAALAPYCRGGAYGGLADAASDALADAPFVAVEATRLLDRPPAERDHLAPLLAAFLHRVERGLDGRPTLLLVDEAWLALRAMPAELDQLLRRLPKRNAALVLATHSLHDVAASPVAATVEANCKARVLLPDAGAAGGLAREALRRFGVGDALAAQLAAAVPKRDLLLLRPDGSRLARLELGPVARALCGAGGEADARLLRRLQAEGPGCFRTAWLRARAGRARGEGDHAAAAALEAAAAG